MVKIFKDGCKYLVEMLNGDQIKGCIGTISFICMKSNVPTLAYNCSKPIGIGDSESTCTKQDIHLKI